MAVLTAWLLFKQEKETQTTAWFELCDSNSVCQWPPSLPPQARDALSAENRELHAKLAEANAKNQQLQAHIAQIRQHTIGFILEQMSTLNPHMDTEV